MIAKVRRRAISSVRVLIYRSNVVGTGRRSQAVPVHGYPGDISSRHPFTNRRTIGHLSLGPLFYCCVNQLTHLQLAYGQSVLDRAVRDSSPHEETSPANTELINWGGC